MSRRAGDPREGLLADRIERVMVVTAHPDDAETGAGGTVARLVREGAQAAYVIVTSGSTGSGDRTMTPERLSRIREAEQRNAARTLGVEHVEFLGYDDGAVEDTHLAFQELLPDYEPHKVHEVYIVKWQEEDHQLAVDISETMDLKLQAVACHQSQFPDFGPMEARLRQRCAALGALHGYAYAETFDRIVIPR